MAQVSAPGRWKTWIGCKLLVDKGQKVAKMRQNPAPATFLAAWLDTVCGFRSAHAILTSASEGYVVDEISTARGQLLVVDIQVNAYIDWDGGEKIR